MRKRIYLVVLSCVLSIFFSACKISSFIKIDKNKHQYIFLGHIYDWKSPSGSTIDSRIEMFNLNKFEQIWLGGDICAATTQNESVLQYLDDELEISKSSTLWAVGNHDVVEGNIDYITDMTGRPLFYSQYNDGITTLVINTTITDEVFVDQCEYREIQFDYIQNVLDTISISKHLVMLMHNVVWSDLEEDMKAVEAANAWAAGVDFLCTEPTWFRLMFYPKLKEIQKNGTQVTIISGDGGQYNKGYKYTADNGIRFFISGINNSHTGGKPAHSIRSFNKTADSVLIFTHDLIEQTLIGKFVKLD